MFRFILLITVFSISFLSCTNDLQNDSQQLPDVNPLQAEIDKELILEYIADSNLVATRDTTGLYYVIETEGEGEHPAYTSSVKVIYSGYLIDGTMFDSGTLEYYPLMNLILGWRIGIPLLKPGGKAKLLLPSALGYGPYIVGSIPANSVLIFDVELVDFR